MIKSRQVENPDHLFYRQKLLVISQKGESQILKHLGRNNALSAITEKANQNKIYYLFPLQLCHFIMNDR